MVYDYLLSNTHTPFFAEKIAAIFSVRYSLI